MTAVPINIERFIGSQLPYLLWKGQRSRRRFACPQSWLQPSCEDRPSSRASQAAVTSLATPRRSVSIKEPNFVSRDLDLWAYAKDVVLDFSRPGKPTDNAFIEAFNGRFRAECLNQHWFLTLDDARQKMEGWRRYYNEERPHGAIGNNVPISLQNHDGATSPPS